MAQADRLAIAAGPFDGYALMRNAGQAVATAILARYPGAARVHLLCGPGNNGGDGYVVARLLHEAGIAVSVWRDGIPANGTDAALAAGDCPIAPCDLAELEVEPGALVVDALYGAGLARPLAGSAATAVDRVARAGAPVVAIDLPSGVSGSTGAVLGSAFRVQLTVTFCPRKPGHLLYPGRASCGEVMLADIGIADAVVEEVQPNCFENEPGLWAQWLPRPEAEAHKYTRGHVGVFSGGPSATGAARLSALAAARAGAGAVTVLSQANAIAANAAHLTSIMIARADTLDEALAFMAERKVRTLVFGPGLGGSPKVGRFLLDMMPRLGSKATVVVDASAITSLASDPEAFFVSCHAAESPRLVLTPHSGEFARLFRELAEDANLSKLDRAREAAMRSNAVVVLKGADTVIAAPDGRAAINANGSPWLATAGSGDVLSGIIAALIAQGMPPFEAACAAVWIHAEAGTRFGMGLIAEDLPPALPPVFRELLGTPEAH